MNFRASADMFVAYPKRKLAVFKDNTMPKRDWSRYDEPTYLRRKVNVARMKLPASLPAALIRQAE